MSLQHRPDYRFAFGQTDPPDADPADELNALRRRLRAREIELRVLHEVTGRIDRSLTHEELFRLLLGTLRRELAPRFEAGLLLDGIGGTLFGFGPLASQPPGEVDQLCEAAARIAGRPVARRNLIYVQLDDAVRPDDAVRLDATLPGPGSAAASDSPARPAAGDLVLVPIHVERTIIGFLALAARHGTTFVEDEVQLLYTLARQASGVVTRLQDALAIEKWKLDTVLTFLPTGVVLLDADDCIALVNPRGRGFLTALTNARDLGDRITRVGQYGFADFLERTPLDLPVRIGSQRPEEPPRTINVIVVDLEPVGGVRRLLVFHDVTPIASRDRLRDQVLATLVHELRGPLASIQSAAEVLDVAEGLPRVEPNEPNEADRDARPRSEDDREPMPGGSAADACLVIRSQTANMRRLVSDLIDMSRSVRTQLSIEPEEFDLARTLRAAAGMVAPQIEARDQRLETSVVEPPLPVYCDPMRLEQVFGNLLHNATKFTPEGGRITLYARTVDAADSIIESRQIEVRISDSGIGLDPDQLDRIFEPFAQVESGSDNGRSAAEGGLGLGLAIAQHLIERHDGTIEVESAGPGQGTTFIVRLPRHEPDDAAPPVRRPRDVLIVDDSDDLRRMLTTLLAARGHRVRQAGSAAEAIRLATERSPEIALLDLGLPDQDGLELARRLRMLCPGSTRLVALSGYGSDEDRDRSRRAGFVDHLVKPPQFDRLMRAVEGD